MPSGDRKLMASAGEAAELLKTLSQETRLMALCFMGSAERSVGEIEAATGGSQSAVSQQLARLRDAGVVAARRDGKNIYYRIADERVLRVIETLKGIFCARR